jgi:hypothetical protein
VTLPASTAIQVEFSETLSSDESVVGDPVLAYVVENVMAEGGVAIPAGSELSGQVVEVKSGRKIGGRSKLTLELTGLRLRGGGEVPIRSTIEFAGKNQTGKDAATIGGSTAGGALLGRVLSGDDKDKGTAIGAVVGAAIGTAVASKNGTDPVVIESGQVTEVLLYEAVELTIVERQPPAALARN